MELNVDNQPTHIAKSLDQVFIDMTVKSMLNPNNPDFYIENLNLQKFAAMFKAMPEEKLDILSIFWTAYSIAEAQYLADKRHQKEVQQTSEVIDDIIDVIDDQLEQLKESKSYRADTDYLYDNVCPECGCPNFVPGVKCPNCDYID